MRVAVCMYGQPRTWAKCAGWHRENFKPTSDMSFDFFCEVKDYNTDKFTGIVRPVEYKELSNLFDAYEPRLTRIDTQAYEGIGAFSSAFQGMFGALLLKQQYEANTSNLYDITVLLRYDVLVGPAVTWFTDRFNKPIELSYIYASGARAPFGPEAYRIGINDLVVVGNSLALDSFSNKLLSNFNPGSDLMKTYDNNLMSPNVTFYKHASDLGLVVDALPLSPIIIRDHSEVPKDISKHWHLLHSHYNREITQQRLL